MFSLRVKLWRIAAALVMVILVALAVRYASVWFFLAAVASGYICSYFIQRKLTRCPHCGALVGRYQKMTWAQRSMVSVVLTTEKPADRCDHCHKSIE